MRKTSAVRVVNILVLAVFLGELGIMYGLAAIGPLPVWQAALLDALTLVFITGPLLHLLVYRPLILEIRARRGAEQALLRVNEDLELRVQERTAELERRTRQISQVAELVDGLQACHSQEEAGRLVARMAERLFAGTHGALFLFSPSRNELEASAAWGGISLPLDGHTITPDQCWALRRGRLHYSDASSAGLPCRHLPAPDGRTSLCIPMIAQGEVLGIVHVSLLPSASVPDRTPDMLTESLAVTFTEQLAITFANLRLREALRDQSIRDSLTGLFNRRYMEETLAREIVRAERSGNPLSVVMLDLDRFKQFNDTHGHEAGDRLLTEFGRLVRAHCRGSDVACRYGGEEFALILPDTPVAVAWERAELLRVETRDIAVPLHEGALRFVTASAGVAAFPHHGCAGEAVLAAADRALYRAKTAGRDRVVVVDNPLDDSPGEAVSNDCCPTASRARRREFRSVAP